MTTFRLYMYQRFENDGTFNIYLDNIIRSSQPFQCRFNYDKCNVYVDWNTNEFEQVLNQISITLWGKFRCFLIFDNTDIVFKNIMYKMSVEVRDLLSTKYLFRPMTMSQETLQKITNDCIDILANLLYAELFGTALINNTTNISNQTLNEHNMLCDDVIIRRYDNAMKIVN